METLNTMSSGGGIHFSVPGAHGVSQQCWGPAIPPFSFASPQCTLSRPQFHGRPLEHLDSALGLPIIHSAFSYKVLRSELQTPTQPSLQRQGSGGCEVGGANTAFIRLWLKRRQTRHGHFTSSKVNTAASLAACPANSTWDWGGGFITAHLVFTGLHQSNILLSDPESQFQTSAGLSAWTSLANFLGTKIGYHH